MKFLLLLIILIISKTIAISSFDWSISSCKGGNGGSQISLEKGKHTIIGRIPLGVTNPIIKLKCKGDLDIQLKDIGSNQMLVAWPNGLLNGPSVNSVDYNGIKIKYSGYNGGQTNITLGNEFISIEGMTQSVLEVSAYGYVSGIGELKYSWSPSKCCCIPSYGQFSKHIEHNAYSKIGIIPIGKRNIKISLKSDHDIDLNLIDQQSGKRLIGWHASASQAGILNGATQACTIWEGTKYCYSGYNGVKSKLGHEYVEIIGATNRELLMTAYGYKPGLANVTYNSIDACCSVQFTMDMNQTIQTHHTQIYKNHQSSIVGGSYIIVRRGSPIYFKTSTPVRIQSATFGTETIQIVNTNKHGTTFSTIIPKTCKVGAIKRTQIIIKYQRLEDDYSAPVYQVVLTNVHCLFNAWDKTATEYLNDKSARDELVLRTDGKYYYGDIYSEGENGIGSQAWLYMPGELFPIVLKAINKFGFGEGFSDARQASRSLSTLLGNLLHGRWSAPYNNGTKPWLWLSSRQILKEFDQTSKPVKYVQCWVFASVYVTFGRSLGLPTRQVTIFRSAHAKPPYVGVIQESLDESVWNFHVVNQVWLNNEFAMTDATPQELSDGIYRMGPAMKSDIVAHAYNKDYDLGFAIDEVDSVFWKKKEEYNATLTLKAYKIHEDYSATDIGRFISTLKTGCTNDVCCEDITCSLKSKDAVLCQPRFLSNNNTEQINSHFKVFVTNQKHILAGDTIDFVLKYAPVDDDALNKRVTVELDAFVIGEDGSQEEVNNCRHCFDKDHSNETPVNECSLPEPSCMNNPKDICNEPVHCNTKPHRSTLISGPNLIHPHYTNFLDLAPSSHLTGDLVEQGKSVELARIAALQKKVYLSNEMVEWKFPITAHQYGRYICSTYTIGLRARVKSNDTIIYAEKAQVTLKPPEMHAYSSCKVHRVYEKFFLYLKIRNPFDFPLTNMILSIDTPDLDDQLLIYAPAKVEAGETIILKSRPISLNKPGRHVITFSLDTCEYPDLITDVTIHVIEDPTFRSSNDQVCTDAE